MEDFPWTFDQFQRYSVLREFIEVFYTNRPIYPGQNIRILDIGGVSPDREGRNFWLPVRRVFAGESFVLDINFCREKGFIQGEGTKLPFRDESFDVAAALDVIEHIPDEKREEFLKEMCRVTKASVVISAPFRDSKIEEAEALLFEEIKRMHGVEHRQLLEHRTFGLPEIGVISGALARHMPAGASFSFGALDNWLFFQTLRNCFLLRRNAGKIHYLLDKWMVCRGFSPESEFTPPFSRHFWVYSKNIDQEALEGGIKKITEELKKRPGADAGYEEAVTLNKEVFDFFSKERVSAVVVSSGRGKHLLECLNHLLTQRVDFDLEVCVFYIKRNPEQEQKVKARFPAVKYLFAEKGEKTPNALLRISAQLAGDFILLLSDDILLPADSVHNFYQELKSSEEYGPLSPRIAWKKWFTPVWAGKRYSPAKIVAGRAVKPSSRVKDKRIDWIFSPCLFFRKEALFRRKLQARSLTKRNIFLWEKGKKRGPSPLFPHFFPLISSDAFFSERRF